MNRISVSKLPIISRIQIGCMSMFPTASQTAENSGETCGHTCREATVLSFCRRSLFTMNQHLRGIGLHRSREPSIRSMCLEAREACHLCSRLFPSSNVPTSLLRATRGGTQKIFLAPLADNYLERNITLWIMMVLKVPLTPEV